VNVGPSWDSLPNEQLFGGNIFTLIIEKMATKRVLINELSQGEKPSLRQRLWAYRNTPCARLQVLLQVFPRPKLTQSHPLLFEEGSNIQVRLIQPNPSNLHEGFDI
jgi:hypothetical protein